MPQQADEAGEFLVSVDALSHAGCDLVGLHDFGNGIGRVAGDAAGIGDCDKAFDRAAAEAALHEAEIHLAAEFGAVGLEQCAEGSGLAVDLFDGRVHAEGFALPCARPFASFVDADFIVHALGFDDRDALAVDEECIHLNGVLP